MAGAALAASALLAVPASPALRPTTQDVTFTAKFAKRDRNKRRARAEPAHDDPHRGQVGARAAAAHQHAAALPQGRRRERPLLSRSAAPRRCAPAGRAPVRKGRSSAPAAPSALAPPIVTDPVNTKITLFNGTLEGRNPTIIIYALPDLGPVMTLPGVLRSGRGTPYGYILDTPVPPIKTLPNAPDAAVTFFDATTRDLTVKRRGRTIHYIDSPVLCDGTFFMLDLGTIVPPEFAPGFTFGDPDGKSLYMASAPDSGHSPHTAGAR